MRTDVAGRVQGECSYGRVFRGFVVSTLKVRHCGPLCPASGGSRIHSSTASRGWSAAGRCGRFGRFPRAVEIFSSARAVGKEDHRGSRGGVSWARRMKRGTASSYATAQKWWALVGESDRRVLEVGSPMSIV